MSRICLDTSAYSHFRRGHAETVAAIDSAREILVPSIVLGELRFGFQIGNRAQENEHLLVQFLAQPWVTVANVDEDAAVEYADIATELRRAGTPLFPNDIWIAAVALREGVPVLTLDQDFSRMPRVGKIILKP